MLPDERKQIQKDYVKANGRVLQILMGRCPNGIIVDADYLKPTINDRHPVPLCSSRGELKYYLGIRKALESALQTGRIPPSLLPLRAPSYLCDLVQS